MKYFASFILILLAFCIELHAQSTSGDIPSPFFTSVAKRGIEGRTNTGLRLFPDRQQYFKPKSMPLNAVAGSPHQTDMYWMSSMTTQSYNHGKIGRFYLWDVQGNLRESKMFFDIAGKNKRGLKLVFSKFRFGS